MNSTNPAELVHVGPHPIILSTGRPVGPGERVDPAEVTVDGDLHAHEQILCAEGVLVAVDSFDGPSNTPDPSDDTPDAPAATWTPTITTSPATVDDPDLKED